MTGHPLADWPLARAALERVRTLLVIETAAKNVRSFARAAAGLADAAREAGAAFREFTALLSEYVDPPRRDRDTPNRYPITDHPGVYEALERARVDALNRNHGRRKP